MTSKITNQEIIDEINLQMIKCKKFGVGAWEFNIPVSMEQIKEIETILKDTYEFYIEQEKWTVRIECGFKD